MEHGGFQASPERTPGTYSKYNSIDDKIDEDKQDDIYDYFKEEAETESIEAALEELGEEDYSEEEIRLMRIKFFSELGN